MKKIISKGSYQNCTENEIDDHKHASKCSGFNKEK
jgi:hypothetical protein